MLPSWRHPCKTMSQSHPPASSVKSTTVPSYRPVPRQETINRAGLVEWFLGCSCADLLPRSARDPLRRISQALDTQQALLGGPAIPQLMLEIHHDASGRTDLSFENRASAVAPELPHLQKLLKQWQSDLRPETLVKAMSRQYCLEFDLLEWGYKLSGIFVKRRDDQELMTQLLDILDLTSCQAPKGGTHPNSDGDLSERLQPWICDLTQQLGAPLWIGRIVRTSSSVKLLIPIGAQSLNVTQTFLEQHFAELIQTIQLPRRSLKRLLQSCMEAGNGCRLSLDLDLLTMRLQPGFGLEIFCPFQRRGQRLGVDQHFWQPPNYSAIPDLRGLESSTALIRRLPYAQRRPAWTMEDEEILFVTHSHSKLVIAESGASIKDYLSVVADVHSAREAS